MSVTFTQTRNELILDSFQLLGVYGIGRTVSSEDMSFAANMLNKMVKAWGTKGLHLFAKEEAVLYVTPGTPSYLLGSTAKAANASEEIMTQLNGALATSSTALVVDSTTGMLAADVIGVVLTDKTIHWTTIASVGSATTITLTTGIVSGASDNAYVYTYTTALTRPLRVLDMRARTNIGADVSDRWVQEVAYQDYMQYSDKNQPSFPSQFNYKPGKSSGVLYLFPCPSDGAERMMFTYERVVDDLNNASDSFDFPPEWLEALTYQLAVRLARPFGKASALSDILPLASLMLKDLMDWDAEISDVQMAPDLGYDY